MSIVLDRIRRLAKTTPQRLMLAETADERIVRAAGRLAREGLAKVSLIGPPDEARATARKADCNLTGVELVDSRDAGAIERTRAAITAARGPRATGADLDLYGVDPVFQAAARVRDGLADCYVAGASRTTADVLRAALWLIGLKPDIKSVSSFFLMVAPDVAANRQGERIYTFADCAVLPDPDPRQLAEIAVLSADNHKRLVQEVPHVAMLSFSTRGSAKHANVDKVLEALRIAREMRPDLHIDGEMQLDAAIVPSVGERKAPGSVVAGHANVLIFPNLDAGNIGYKLVQRFAGASAIGPLLQGLAKQANDLSRGCSVEDVVDTATVACAMSAGVAAYAS